MVKIGIMSMQRIKNYGSFLQAYGLKSILEDLGHQVTFVDYKVENPIITSKDKNKIMSLFGGGGRFHHKLQYIHFKINYSSYLKKYLGITKDMNYTPNLDTLIVGSDEVFNCIQSNKNVGYSLELFGKNNKAKKLISYAASFGNTTIKKLETYEKKYEIGAYLNQFDAISVRDGNSKLICNELCVNEISTNIDPVLAYDFSKEMNKNQLRYSKKKYLVVYAYSNRMTDEEMLAIKKYANQKSLKIYTIGGVQSYANSFINCNPFEVLSYFSNAEAIITDTFHGTIFSIITRKNFLTIMRKSDENHYGNEEKLSDLLHKFKLENRFLDDLNLMQQLLEQEIDYDFVNQKLNLYRSETLNYLNENI